MGPHALWRPIGRDGRDSLKRAELSKLPAALGLKLTMTQAFQADQDIESREVERRALELKEMRSKVC